MMRIEPMALRERPVLAAMILGILVASVLVVSPALASKESPARTQAGSEGIRTLEAIQIEGEIAIPQVLFITSRDHPRFRDGLRERYRESALEIGRGTQFPHRFLPLSEHPQPQR